MTMKRLTTLIVLLVAFVQSYAIEWQENDQVAVAFLGYYDTFGMLKESADYQRLCREYPELSEFSKFTVDTYGQEVYLIIPRDKEALVTVREYTSEMALNGTDYRDGKELYYVEEGKPLLVHCNVSDAYSDISVHTVADEIETYVCPRLDLNTGGLVYNANVLDISQEIVQEGKDFIDLDTGEFTMGDKPVGMKVMLKNGRVSVFYDREKINAWMYEGVCHADGWVNLWGINGWVKSIYVADIGQDTNPVLGMIMNDGTVRVFRLFDGIWDGKFVSPKQKNMTGIVRFTDVAKDKEERDYVTFFAEDAKGRQHEVSLQYPIGSIDYQGTGEYAFSHCVISLGNSGVIQYLASVDSGKPVVREGEYENTVIGHGKDHDILSIDYHLTRVLTNGHWSYSRLDGSFTMKYYHMDNKVIITPTRGNELGIGIGQSRTLKLVGDKF